jgi:hypothetical protein
MNRIDHNALCAPGLQGAYAAASQYSASRVPRGVESDHEADMR